MSTTTFAGALVDALYDTMDADPNVFVVSSLLFGMRPSHKLLGRIYERFSDRIVEHLGGDPTRHIAVGVGYGLERIAMLRYGIDDARKIDVASVA